MANNFLNPGVARQFVAVRRSVWNLLPAPAPVQPLGWRTARRPSGYTGPGIYRVIAPRGLDLYLAPTPQSLRVDGLAFGSQIQVLADAGNGWVQVLKSSPYDSLYAVAHPGSPPFPKYMCINCPELPGGPWLERMDAFSATATIGAASFGYPQHRAYAKVCWLCGK